MTHVVKIVVPLYMPKLLDYAWAGEGAPSIGQFVQVTVGTKTAHGVIVELPESSPYKRLKKAMPVEAPALSPDTLQFFRWVTQYNLAYPGEALRACLEAGHVPPKNVPEKELVAARQKPDMKNTPARDKVLGLIAQKPYENMTSLAADAEVSSGVVSSLIKAGAIVWQDKAQTAQDLTFTPVKLNPAQEQAARALSSAALEKTFHSFLLDGVTGSGKTEVYFATIADILDADPTAQILVLVPEISLTPQWLDRFAKRFGFTPAVWHSALTPKQRRSGWWGAATGDVRVVVGARSALFLPYKNLKLVVVDEEHDPSYKQEEGFRYHGRDMAVVRARLASCPVLLASATPSLESFHNASIGRYTTLHLPNRHGGATMPDLRTVDLKLHPPKMANHFLSPVLIKALGEKMLAGEQSLLFLNRRGFAPLLICRKCGWRADCPSCDASLVVHKTHLACHHCGFEEPLREECPACFDDENLHPFGPGTRKLKEEVLEHFPAANVMVVDSDSVSTPAQMREVVTAVENGDIDVLIGTQMIAKGHHFENLTLVGVVDADLGLAHGDLRASERTFQLLSQVSGRAGRASKPGQVYLQTHSPDHPLFDTLKTMDRDSFFHLELTSRQRSKNPPFGRLVAIIVSGEREDMVRNAAAELVRAFPHDKGVTIMGPAPAPLARVRDRWRYRLLLQGTEPLQKIVKAWVGGTPMPNSIRIDIDIDPQSFY